MNKRTLSSPTMILTALVAILSLVFGVGAPATAHPSRDNDQGKATVADITEITHSQIAELALNFHKSSLERKQIEEDENGLKLYEYDLGEGSSIVLPEVDTEISPRFSIRKSKKYVYLRFNQTDQKAMKLGKLGGLGAAVCAVGKVVGCVIAATLVTAGGVYVSKNGICRTNGKKTLQVKLTRARGKLVSINCVK